MLKKRLANWTGGGIHILFQLGISIKSYLLYPFVKEKENAIKEYWSSIYSGKTKDDYIFDGMTEGYYDSLLRFINSIPEIDSRTIVDLCSGKGGLFTWCKQHGVSYGSYIGVDFAVSDAMLSENATLIQKDILAYKTRLDDIVIIVNGLCYLDNDQYIQVINNICNSRDLVVIEPVPSLFWDAQFDNIILHYRSLKQVRTDLENKGYKCKYEEVDYLFRIFGKYMLGLKYAMYLHK